MQLTWKASESTSALYAALMLTEGRVVADARLAAAFTPAVEIAQSEFETANVAAVPLLTLLTGLAASGVEDNRRLIEQAFTKLFGRGTPQAALVGRLAGTLGGLKAAFHNACRATTADTAADTAATDSPSLVDELLLRGRPLFEQWEARGPGLLLQIARSTEENLLVENAAIVLVCPLVGGNGIAHAAFNTVTFEAVLTNPVPDLPETLRLAWLLAQLNLDLPNYAEHLSAARREMVGQLALLPPVLAAAEYVELAPFTAESIDRAISAWRIKCEASHADVPGTLLTWWQTYDESATPWPVALAALEKMLFL